VHDKEKYIFLNINEGCFCHQIKLVSKCLKYLLGSMKVALSSNKALILVFEAKRQIEVQGNDIPE